MAAGRRRAVAVLLVALLAVGCAGGGRGDPSAGPVSSTAGDAVPVVVDTDLAVDDLVALAFLLSAPAVDVRAVTVSGTGEVRCPQGLTVVRGLLGVTGDEGIPVACGRSTPLAGDHAFPSEWRDLADSGWGLDLPGGEPPAADVPATDLLADTLGAGGVTLLTLGPLTNVAEAFRADPGLADRVASVVVMGGAVDVPGNVPGEGSGPSVAEWNVYVDPTAAAEVLASGAPVVLVGLDATDRLPVTGDFLELSAANAHTEVAGLVDGLIRNNPQVYTGEAFFWDALAAAVVVDPRLVRTRDAAISVVTAPGPDLGRTLRADDGAPVALAARPRAAAFEELLLRTLDQVAPDADLVTPPPPVGRGAIGYDGRTCRYDGPASVPAGRMRFTFETTDPGWSGAVVGLTGERSIASIIAWLEAHPASREPVPGIVRATPVPAGFAMYVDVSAPRVAVVCAADEPIPAIGGTIEVE